MTQPPDEGDELMDVAAATAADDLAEMDDYTANLAVYPDEPPKSGEWVDTDDVFADITKEEMEAGRQLGEDIDVEDDESGSEPSDAD
jgi:hypothetical protein